MHLRIRTGLHDLLDIDGRRIDMILVQRQVEH
jgi:hypothetical protein